MRIIAGTHRRKTITPPSGFKARPTTDFAKENLFNILGNYFDLENIDALDLFSGTGSISYEFASREANSVLSIEMNPMHHRFIQRTAAELNFQTLRAVCTNVFVYLKTARGTKFDIIFADPPYQLEGIQTIPDLVFGADLVKSDGWLIVEHGNNTDFSSHPQFREMRKYGSVHFSIFEPKAE